MNKYIQFFIWLLISIVWIILLNRPIANLPALGPFFSPKTGFWANAEDITGDEPVFLMPSDSLKDSLIIILHDRMIPHIIAQEEEDLYFAQGYLHAHFRLWQMDFYTRLAAGRLSEVFGKEALQKDQEQRRKGLVWAAESALKQLEKDPKTKAVLDQYTRGVNNFLSQLRFHHYPIEYKLLNYTPEPWTNLKTMLIFKLMADDLTGESNDIAHSYYKSILSNYDFEFLFPSYLRGAIPTINKQWPTPQSKVPNAPAAMVFSEFSISDQQAFLNSLNKKDGLQKNGSNNWVVSREKTMFDNVLLANDPHLQLSVPSIWFEMQLSTPEQNVYGVSIPGLPSILIGFNDDISWGITNHYADVKDFYEIIPNDEWTSYSFDQEWVPFNTRIEKIKIKNEEDFIDTVYYTIHGPVIYDTKFPEPTGSGKILAMKWQGHYSNNELKALIEINKSSHFESFEKALALFGSPAQNFIYGDIYGNIGMIEAGAFPNKFKNQGQFVMLGNTSATLWNGYIPYQDNPKTLNPKEQYLSSANNTPVNQQYPYEMHGDYTESRNKAIHQYLSDSSMLSVTNMKQIQNSNFSVIAESLSAYFKKTLSETEDKYAYFKKWADDFTPYYSANSSSITAFHIWHQILYHKIWNKHFYHLPSDILPSLERTIQLMVHYPNNKYFEYNQAGKSITLQSLMQESLLETADSMQLLLPHKENTEWAYFKNTQIKHLLSIDAFSYLDILNGGWSSSINATTGTHGPSWRMVIDLNPYSGVKGYGIKPGGQSGNPGSAYYNYAIEHWIEGEYYDLPFMNKQKVKNQLAQFKENKPD